jgi:transcriptional regulator with XRE-family HTH domain
MFLKRISQTKLAPMIGISQSVLSKKLRGSVPWSVTELIRAASALGVDPVELLPETSRRTGLELPQLDLNQQPFGYMSALVSANMLTLGGGSVVPLFAPGDPRWTVEPKPATRREHDRPNRPILVSVRHLIAN